MFRHEISPYSVNDKVRFRNLDKTIDIDVKADASQLVTGLMKANARLTGMTEETTEEEKTKSALLFAGAMFGNAQAEKLLEFYDREPLSLINACSVYFDKRLKKLITKAQKRK